MAKPYKPGMQGNFSCQREPNFGELAAAKATANPTSLTTLLLVCNSFLLAKLPADFRKQRVFRGFAADAQISAVRFRERGGLQSFAYAPLVIIYERKIAVGGHIVGEELQCFAPPFDATVKFRIGLYEHTGLQIGAAKLEPANPGVQQLVGFGECFNRSAAISLLEGRLSLNDFGIGFRLCLRLGSEAGREFLRFGCLPCFRKDSAG